MLQKLKNCLATAFSCCIYLLFVFALLGMIMISKKNMKSSNKKYPLIATLLFVFYLTCFVALIVLGFVYCLSGLKQIFHTQKIEPEDEEDPRAAN